jgi:hypothetical protein
MAIPRYGPNRNSTAAAVQRKGQGSFPTQCTWSLWWTVSSLSTEVFPPMLRVPVHSYTSIIWWMGDKTHYITGRRTTNSWRDTTTREQNITSCRAWIWSNRPTTRMLLYNRQPDVNMVPHFWLTNSTQAYICIVVVVVVVVIIIIIIIIIII